MYLTPSLLFNHIKPTKMKPELIKIEQQIREHAIAIVTLYERAKELNDKAALAMLAGAKQYIDEIITHD